MTIEALGLIAALALAPAGGDGRAAWAALVPSVTFRPRERAVSDWRTEAGLALSASPGTRLAILLGRDPAAVTRCVRLNNYWCIKRAGWSGEIAADGEGHVAFASAAEGATVAALLLRRYYVDYGRHSALAIVSHWAPASCGAVSIAIAGGGKAPALRRPSPRGIGGTLRARWLASHGRRVAALGRGRGRASSVPDRLIGRSLPAVSIAVGPGLAPETGLAPEAGLAPEIGLGPPRKPSRPAGGTGAGLSAFLEPATLGLGPPVPLVPPCSADTARIANYAAKAAAGIAGSVTADLGLFDVAGRPTPRLAVLLRNMAAVEIGPLGVETSLVETAVAHASAVSEARRAAAGPGAAGPAGLHGTLPPDVPR